MNKPNSVTKVTIEFPNGNKETFETVGVVGAFIMSHNTRGAQLGAFATGKFTPATITGVATGVMEAVAREMMNQDILPQYIEESLTQIIPHAVASAAIRKVDERMEQLENEEDPMVAAIAKLLRMYVQ